MRLPHSLILLLFIATTSCSPNPRTAIVGKWEYDRAADGNSTSDDWEARLRNMLSSTNTYYGSTLEFFSNGNYRITQDFVETNGTYYFENRDQTLTLTEDVYYTETSVDVISISHDEVELRFPEGQFVFKRVQ